MADINISREIERLLLFGLQQGMIEEADMIPVRNALMDLLKVEEPYGYTIEEVVESPAEILNNMLDYGADGGILADNSITSRDLMDTRIMGLLMPRQSEVAKKFQEAYNEEGPKKATDYFYRLSQSSNYIRMDRIKKNLYWRGSTVYGPLEITINLSKPEKDPREIEAARKAPRRSYPKCLLCVENVGYQGNMNHPARQNHRVIPLKLNEEQWYFQYSPYVYYNEHCIVFHGEHIPMKISEKTFTRLLDFIEKFPHYFIGSNADIPIVGGSILAHEHFQGGRHIFPMEEAAVEEEFVHPAYNDIKIGIVKWPMSVIRISGRDREKLTKLAADFLCCWRGYSDESVEVLSHTEKDGEKVPHNTITPIARKNSKGEFELDLVLRNNRATEEHPEGIFHPHRELHHIKKENIGLIEVMGLAVLPGRLSRQLNYIKKILAGEIAYLRETLVDEGYGLKEHLHWIEDMVKTYGRGLKEGDAKKILENEVTCKFLDVLLDAGVFKRDMEGKIAFRKFMNIMGCISKDKSLEVITK